MLYAFALLIGVGVFARHRLELLRDMVLAAVLAVVVGAGLTRWIDNRWPELAFFDLQTDEGDVSGVLRHDLGGDPGRGVAVADRAGTQGSGGRSSSSPSAAAALGGVTTVSDALGGLLVGLIAAAIVRYAFGTSAGLPSTNRLRAGLADLGVHDGHAVVLRRAADRRTRAVGNHRPTDGTCSSPGWAEIRGAPAGGARLWRQAWYQDDSAQYGSDRRQQIEHESLVLLLADKHGVSVPDLVTVGMTRARRRAARHRPGRPHAWRAWRPTTSTTTCSTAAWVLLGDLHSAGISHGSLDDIHIWVDSAGGLQLMGFSEAAINPTDEQTQRGRRGDARPDDDRRRRRPGDRRGSPGKVRRRAGGDAPGAADRRPERPAPPSREAAPAEDRRPPQADRGGASGSTFPPIEQLTRVTWKSVLMTAFIGFAAYTLIGGLAEVGFDTIADSLADARWSLVLLGLALAAATNYTDAVALAAVSPKPVPVGVTTIEQFAIGFVNVAVPSAAGRVATNARYFQKFGISPVTSTTSGAITGFIGFVAQAILVVLTILVGAGSIDLSDLQGGGSVLRLLGMAVVVFVVAIALVAVVPTWRHWVWSKIETPLSQIGDALRTVREPKIALTALGSSIGTEILYAAGFAMCVAAVGGSVTLGQAIFINVTVSLFAGLMPVPGGIGVSEAGMTAGLTRSASTAGPRCPPSSSTASSATTSHRCGATSACAG